jgi:hypothetical protein
METIWQINVLKVQLFGNLKVIMIQVAGIEKSIDVKLCGDRIQPLSVYE